MFFLKVNGKEIFCYVDAAYWTIDICVTSNYVF